mgnify:CR=1 FL=1
MTDSHPTAEQVGVVGGIATFLLSLFGIHRSSQAKVHARIDELERTKADKEEFREWRRENGEQHSALAQRLDAVVEHLMDLKK